MLASFAPMASAIFACMSRICARVSSSAVSKRAISAGIFLLGDRVVGGRFLLRPQDEIARRETGRHPQTLKTLLGS